MSARDPLCSRRRARFEGRLKPTFLHLPPFPQLLPHSIVPTSRGCHTYVVREGWEGLVRGNGEHTGTVPPTPASPADIPLPTGSNDGRLQQPLSFGAGEALKYQSLDSLEETDAPGYNPDEHHGGKFIIRVGWDDVRGWLGEVSSNSPWEGLGTALELKEGSEQS